jgi:hypothetical protein
MNRKKWPEHWKHDGDFSNYRISEQDRAEIPALAKTINPATELFVARKSDREFKFEFDRA